MKVRDLVRKYIIVCGGCSDVCMNKSSATEVWSREREPALGSVSCLQSAHAMTWTCAICLAKKASHVCVYGKKTLALTGCVPTVSGLQWESWKVYPTLSGTSIVGRRNQWLQAMLNELCNLNFLIASPLAPAVCRKPHAEDPEDKSIHSPGSSYSFPSLFCQICSEENVQVMHV